MNIQHIHIQMQKTSFFQTWMWEVVEVLGCAFSNTSPIEPTNLEEKKDWLAVHSVVKEEKPWFHKYSSLSKLLGIAACVLRYCHNLKKKSVKIHGPISVLEREAAMLRLIKMVQQNHFSKDITALSPEEDEAKEKESPKVIQLPKGSKLANLNPFLDEQKLVRVGGRLRNSDLPEERKFPILLPHDAFLTKLLVRDVHQRECHAGPTLLLATLRQKYWILKGRQVVRSIVHGCMRCKRFAGATLDQIIGNLPRARTEARRPFEIVGVDYAGPFILLVRKGRGAAQYKAWVALFVCFVTKAVQIELVTDMTSEAFIAAARRFTGRRSHV